MSNTRMNLKYVYFVRPHIQTDNQRNEMKRCGEGGCANSDQALLDNYSST